ncbi:MAG: 50S ribosomal protein L18 [Candidatus Cloacimonetes bacterium]|nr:50S ribosomal protein L18 [Candidatus Cloacimonadota bacterium]
MRKKESITYKKEMARKRRVKAIRKKISGTEERPRLVVFRSVQNIYGQIIDDQSGKTMVSFSTIAKEEKIDTSKKKTEQSFAAGLKLGEKAINQGIKKICFDRNGYLYHGRVKAFAEGARKAGLEF